MRYVGDDKVFKVIVGHADEKSYLDNHLENISHTHMFTLQQGTATYHTHIGSHCNISHTHTQRLRTGQFGLNWIALNL